VESIGIVGSGTMGAGLGAIFLRYGRQVTLFDNKSDRRATSRSRVERLLQRSVDRNKLSAAERDLSLARLTIATDLAELSSCGVVIEAVYESAKTKQTVLADTDRTCTEATMLASVTSSISITRLAAATQRPERVIGLHFFNPVHAMKLVEVVPGMLTSENVVAQATNLARSVGKTVVLAKNRPGFLVNRIARPFYAEAMRVVEEGTASIETVDMLITALGFRMGPFAAMDLIGLDTNLAVTRSVFEATFQDPRYRPHPMQAEMVDAGLLGRKSGKGFYEYSAD
jgi:3-hydroxybutyryl-CoA dehydrogenase